MKDIINFGATNETFKGVFTKGIFEVPPFQRDYSWTTDELDDLWDDLAAANQENTTHYMGYLVFQIIDNSNRLRIIDGQQRITSISILIAALLKKIDEFAKKGDNDSQTRYDALHQMYLGYFDPVSLVTNPKVKLNRHNDSFFQDHIVSLQKFPARGVIGTNKLIQKAFEFFEKKIDSENFKNSEECAQFIQNTVETFFFTEITVLDELNAFRVFETLNARGVQLSSSDLLKNYILSIVFANKKTADEFQSAEGRWEKIVKTLGTEKFPEFLRYYWNSRHKTVRKTELFKAIRKEILTRDDVFSLMQELLDNSDLYVALQKPQDEMWNQCSPQFRQDIDYLTLFNIKQHIPLLLAVYVYLKDDFEKITHWLMVIAFRYNVICASNPNEQERIYNDIAVKITKKEITKASEVQQILLKVYPSDAIFYSSFAEKAINISKNSSNKIVKYILCSIEEYLSHTTLDYNSAKLSIEHIFPENPEKGWPDFASEAEAEKVFLLGNYTLLPQNVNRDLENKPYSEKRPVYQKSCYEITKQIAEKYEDWDIACITKRQREELANLAKTIWKIS